MKEKFCLTSVASFSQINSSLNNKSKTKQTFSFGKTPRFDHLKPVYPHPHVDVSTAPTEATSSNTKFREPPLDTEPAPISPNVSPFPPPPHNIISALSSKKTNRREGEAVWALAGMYFCC